MHEAEILADVEAPAGTPYAELTAAFSTVAEDLCNQAFDGIEINTDNLTADFTVGYFFASEREWNKGNRTVQCWASSPAGFPGRLLLTSE